MTRVVRNGAIPAYGSEGPVVLASWRVARARFEWNPKKDRENQTKHGVGFAVAQLAFADPSRVIAEDLSHGAREERYYCFGRVEGSVLTVRFTFRGDVIRIFGAGRWRRGKTIYERQNQIHE